MDEIMSCCGCVLLLLLLEESATTTLMKGDGESEKDKETEKRVAISKSSYSPSFFQGHIDDIPPSSRKTHYHILISG